MPLQVVTANVNGIRAALRRGGLDWLAGCGADVICLQEVRATPDQVDECLGAAGLGGWQLALAPGPRGHAGVALLSRHPLRGVGIGIGGGEFADRGRWVAADVDVPFGAEASAVQVASVYVHTGDSEGPRRAEKDRFLEEVGAWLATHREVPAVVCGDLNVARTNRDIKNWRGNRGRAGFLESERAHLDRWFADPPAGLGWADLGRRLGGDGPGPYTWWSWRGRGFDTDGGWRIDYVLASPPLAARATGVVVHRAASYAQRWSDHAPVTATFR